MSDTPGGWSSPDDRSGGQPDRSQDPGPDPYPAAPPPPQGHWGPPPAPKPGVIPLRPLGLGEILDGAITAIRTYPKQMLGMSALVSAVSNLLSIGVMLYLANETTLLYSDLPLTATDNERALEELGMTLILSIPTIVFGTLANTFLTGLLTVVVGKAVLGQKVTVGQAWAHVRPRFFALLGLSVLYVLIVLAGGILFIIPGIWMYVLFSLASNALILEGATVGKALGRSRTLVSGAWWRTFGILLLAFVIAWVIGQIVQTPFALLTGGLGVFTGGSPVNSLGGVVALTALGAILAETIVLPFQSGVTTLLYIDRRMRREGMDIELARQAGAAPPQPPTAW